MKTRDLTYMALYLALFAVLEFISGRLPILRMPQGGSIGIAVIPLLLASYHLGWKKGVLVGVLSVALKWIVGASIWIVDFPQFMLEYILAFGIYGIAVLFKNFKIGPIAIYTGIIATSVLRFLFHYIAGVFYWGAGWYGSFIYNFGYMFGTMILCLIVVPIFMGRLPAFKNKDHKY
jgi:thiamine transporter